MRALLGGRLLGDDLLGRGLGGGLGRRLLHHRGGIGAGRLRRAVGPRVSVAGGGPLALGRLAVALAHVFRLRSWCCTRLRARRWGFYPIRPTRSARALRCPQGAVCTCSRWGKAWLSRRFAKCASPTSVPPKVIAAACGIRAWCSGAYETPIHR